MSNYVPNEMKKFSPRDTEWINGNVKNLLRKQNKLYKKYRRNGYKSEDKEELETTRMECSDAIKNAKENFLKSQGAKLSDPNTGQKTYWNILNRFLNKCKIPRIPPLFHDSNFIINCKEKASIFNGYFSSQCTPFVNYSSLPPFHFHTNSRIGNFKITATEINDILVGLTV